MFLTLEFESIGRIIQKVLMKRELKAPLDYFIL